MEAFCAHARPGSAARPRCVSHLTAPACKRPDPTQARPLSGLSIPRTSFHAKMASFKPACVKDVPAQDFIAAYAAHLKSNDKLHLPTWVDTVKTATFKELAPYDEDWYFVRAAAVCRRLYIRPDIGIGRFQTFFGGRASRGNRPEKFTKASGGLIRHILKSLEEIGIVEKSSNVKGGRRLTGSGQRDMDLIAGRCQVSLNVF